MNVIFKTLLEELEKNNDVILATLIDKEGTSPQRIGAQMLVGTKGRIIGTVGGGLVEWNCEQAAKRLLEEKKSEELKFAIQTNQEKVECGGGVTICLQYVDASVPFWKEFSEKILYLMSMHKEAWFVCHTDGNLPALVGEDGKVLYGEILPERRCTIPLPIKERVILFGGGHCAQALVPVLSKVGFRITVMENRPELASTEIFPEAEQIICGNYANISDYIQIQPSDYVIVMTNGHDNDYEVQRQILENPPFYLGVIGSKRKKAEANQKLREDGFSEEMIQFIHCPIGTEIKAVTPNEIAISIAGELICERASFREKYGTKKQGCPMH